MWKDERQKSLLKVSDVHFTPIRPRSGLIGFVQFVIDDTYAIGGVGVHTRLNREGIRLVYPSKILSDGTNVSLFHPIAKDVGDELENRIFQIIQKLGFGGCI